MSSTRYGAPSLRWTYLTALVFRLVLFYVPHMGALSALLERRPELCTPVSSFMTCEYPYPCRMRLISPCSVKEALYLESLHTSSNGSLPKPYASGSLYLPPILLFLARPLHVLEQSPEMFHLCTALAWSLADLFAAYTLASIFTRKQRYVRQRNKQHPSRTQNGTQLAQVDNVVYAGAFFSSAEGVAACYLWNPMTIATCLARSTGSFNNLAILASVHAAIAGSCFGDILDAHSYSQGSPLFLSVWLALASFISLYPILLTPSTVLLCATRSVQETSKRSRKVSLCLTNTRGSSLTKQQELVQRDNHRVYSLAFHVR